MPERTYKTQLLLSAAGGYGPELEENEKGYFDEKRLNYIHLLGDRAGRLFDSARQLTEYCQTLREVYQAEIDHRQNRHMQFLTVITIPSFSR